jgi:hypothetical protein
VSGWKWTTNICIEEIYWNICHFLSSITDLVPFYHKWVCVVSERHVAFLSQVGMKPITEEDKSVPEFVKMQRRITSKTPTSPPTWCLVTHITRIRQHINNTTHVCDLRAAQWTPHHLKTSWHWQYIMGPQCCMSHPQSWTLGQHIRTVCACDRTQCNHKLCDVTDVAYKHSESDGG